MHSATHSHVPARSGSPTGGFTVLEVMIVAALLPLAVLGSLSLVNSGQRAHETARNQSVTVHKLQVTLARIADELRTGGRLGEDRNDNGRLDVGEDRNGNGRFDTDWRLTSSSVRFNRVLANGTYSLPISYSLEGDQLVRTELVDASAGTVVRAAVASKVTPWPTKPLPSGSLIPRPAPPASTTAPSPI